MRKMYFVSVITFTDETKEILIPAGEYEFPFQFQLPQNIPTSFVGAHGRVAYSVTAVIDRPWKFDHEDVAFFSVICNYDLNLPEHKELAEAPQSVSDHKFMCCWCCKSGPVSGSGQIERTGFVPGETVTVRVMADNKSNLLIKPIRVLLLQTQTFKADKIFSLVEEKESINVIQSFESPEPLEPGESESYPDIMFKIPALPGSELEHCTKIDVNYTIQIEVPPKGCHMTLEVPIPILIGTIPLQSTFKNLNAPTPSDNSTSNFWLDTTPEASGSEKDKGAYEMRALLDTQNNDAASNDQGKLEREKASAPALQKLYPDLPPPTYEMAKDMPVGDQPAPTMRMNSDNEHATGNWDFKPIYPYYE